MEKEPENPTPPADRPFDPYRDEYPQFLYVETMEEELFESITDNDESPDDYWAKGWTLNIIGGIRSNYDVYLELFYKAFPTRYRVNDFALTQSLRRVLAKNDDLKCVIRPLRITSAKEQLYFQFHIARFHQPPRETLLARYDHITMHPAELTELCIFQGEELIAFSIFEVGDKAAWSNIGVWSPHHPDRSLGTFTILKEIEFCRSREMDFHYLGHYFTADPKYSYKTRFSGLELYDWDNDRWLDYEDPHVPAMLEERLPRRPR